MTMHPVLDRFLLTLSTKTRNAVGQSGPWHRFPIFNQNRLFVEKLSSRHISTTLCLFKISPIKTPNFPESITEGDIRWISAVGDQVGVDAVIGEIETDKTSLPVVSPCAGKIAEFLVEDGAKVTKGQVVCNIDESAVNLKAEQPSAPVSETIKLEESPKKAQGSPKTTQDAAKGKPQEPSVHPSGQRLESRVQMTRMRRTIAERLKEAQNTNAMLTTFNEVDMTTAVEIRNRHKDRILKGKGVKLGFMSAFMSASVHALKMQPIVNAVINGNDIVYRDYIDISVAVSSPKGLVVPVVRNAHLLNAVELERAVAELAEKARKGQLAIEDMEGGTFTISNGGVFGSMLSTPIINIPQSAILGLHAIKDRPVAIAGKVEIRPIMYVALTYDHRLVDGREAVTFLKRIKDVVEDPSNILMGL